MREVVVLKNQTLFDIAIQELGSAAGVSSLAKTNGISRTADLVPGSTLLIDTPVIDEERYNYYKTNRIKPATIVVDIALSTEKAWQTPDGENWETPDGEYWEWE